MAPSALPFTGRRLVGIRSSRKLSTTQAFHSVVRAPAKRPSHSTGRAGWRAAAAGSLRESGDGRFARSTLERLRTTLATLNLAALDARREALLESAAKKQPAYADFLLETMSREADARRPRYLQTRLQLAPLP